MRRSPIPAAVAVAFLLPGLAAAEPSALLKEARAHFSPLPAVAAPKDPVAAARVELGRRLFFENRASADGNIGCFFCHQADKGGADGWRRRSASPARSIRAMRRAFSTSR